MHGGSEIKRSYRTLNNIYKRLTDQSCGSELDNRFGSK